MSKAVRIGSLVLGGAVAVLSMAACTPAFGGSADRTTPAAAEASTAPGASASTATGSNSRNDSGNAAPAKSGGTGTGNATGGGAGNGPRIVSFQIVQQPRCASGTSAYETPAVPLKISWKVTGATGMALSVDDPGVGSYGTYGTEGTLEFTFSCGGAVGSTETHQYTLTTTGSGHPKAKTLSVSTKVLEKGTKV